MGLRDTSSWVLWGVRGSHTRVAPSPPLTVPHWTRFCPDHGPRCATPQHVWSALSGDTIRDVLTLGVWVLQSSLKSVRTGLTSCSLRMGAAWVLQGRFSGQTRGRLFPWALTCVRSGAQVPAGRLRGCKGPRASWGSEEDGSRDLFSAPPEASPCVWVSSQLSLQGSLGRYFGSALSAWLLPFLGLSALQIPAAPVCKAPGPHEPAGLTPPREPQWRSGFRKKATRLEAPQCLFSWESLSSPPFSSVWIDCPFLSPGFLFWSNAVRHALYSLLLWGRGGRLLPFGFYLFMWTFHPQTRTMLYLFVYSTQHHVQDTAQNEHSRSVQTEEWRAPRTACGSLPLSTRSESAEPK